MSALLIVRATVPADQHDAFDRWYQDEHLPDAHKAFGSLSARRGWSDIEDNLHVAIYEFTDEPTAQATAHSEKIGELIAEFDRVWQGRVTRTREVLGICHQLDQPA